MSTRTFEIFYRDLNDDCKRRYLEFQRVSDVSELNEDLAPLVMIDVEDEPEGTEGQDRQNYTDTQDRDSYKPEA